MIESRQWRPDKWTREIVRRFISNARRQVYRVSQTAESIEEARGFGNAVMAFCQSEAALEATVDCPVIAETCERVARRLRVIELPLQAPAISNGKEEAKGERNRSKAKSREHRRRSRRGQARAEVFSDSRRLA